MLKIKVDYGSKRVKGIDAMGKKLCHTKYLLIWLIQGCIIGWLQFCVCVCAGLAKKIPSSCQGDLLKLLILHAVLGQMLVK